MSRSRWKSHTKHGTFDSVATYFSNKKDKRIANQCFRSRNKQIAKEVRKLMDYQWSYTDGFDYDDIHMFPFLYHIRECSDVWGFQSDGLKRYYKRKGSWYKYSDEDWDKLARK